MVRWSEENSTFAFYGCFFSARETAAVYKIFEISFFKRIFYLEQIKVFEALFQIITQNLKTSNAIQIRRRPQTLDNIVHKTNLKFGGLNYVMQMESKEYGKSIYFLYF